jgi:iron complex transport system ATP-binding protein
MKTLLARDIGYAYGDYMVLERLTLVAQPGQVLGLIGPNGVGKTTLLRLLARLLPPLKGTVHMADHDLWDMTPKQVAQCLSLTPQENPSWPLTVEQVVSLGRAPHRGWLLPLSAADREAINRALERTGLFALRGRLLTELSGGEQRRVVLARALCQEPQVLLLDEPTAYLDLRYQSDILDMITRLAHEDGLTIVITMHDLNQAALYADCLALLAQGQVLALGTPDDVLTSENVSRAYGVEVVVSRHPVYDTPLIAPLLYAGAPGLKGRTAHSAPEVTVVESA